MGERAFYFLAKTKKLQNISNKDNGFFSTLDPSPVVHDQQLEEGYQRCWVGVEVVVVVVRHVREGGVLSQTSTK